MFDLTVNDNGYAWWYLDAISDNQQSALTIIVFIGSVFSPYYKRARRKHNTDPLQHCAVNAIVYGDNRHKKHLGRWAMTERSANAVQQSAHHLKIGPSDISLEDNKLRIYVNEISVPIPRKLKGEITVTLPPIVDSNSAKSKLNQSKPNLDQVFDLDHQSLHQWNPIAPRCSVHVDLEHPELQWKGNAYFDHNRGSEPIEQGFKSWNWCRLNVENNETLVIYDRVLPNLDNSKLLLKFDSSGSLIEQQIGAATLCNQAQNQTKLPTTPIWRMPRSVRCDQATTANVIRTLEDTPFYSRSEIQGTFGGLYARGIHESISLTRLTNPLVQLMLPFRMPRRG